MLRTKDHKNFLSVVNSSSDLNAADFWTRSDGHYSTAVKFSPTVYVAKVRSSRILQRTFCTLECANAYQALSEIRQSVRVVR